MKCSSTQAPDLAKATPGARLKWFRQQNGLSQEAFGYPLGMVQSQVSRYENGCLSLSIEIAQLISRFYKISLIWLLTGQGEQ